MVKIFDYFYIFATIFFTVYGQLILKVRISKYGALPADFFEKLKFLILLLFDPGIFSGFLAAFLASLAWMATMTKFDLSYAYPFMSLNFVIVILLSYIVLDEPISLNNVVGVALIVIGTIVAAKG
ncbi:EamA family transporter [Vibrio rhizosphaerae]|uniref:EamA family transporter n=1 Tax=Vibrio rhizosphaerae TaxID=398736 RepID=UPI0005706968|nr:EamA family transporter [Vibrio rhizosphaerae]